jgi:PKD domain
MKNLFFFTIILLQFQVIAQKHDNLWLFGYGFQEPVRRMTLDFDKDSLGFVCKIGELPLLYSGAWVCDSIGKLQLLTSGCNLVNSMENEILNGDSLNPGYQFNLSCQNGTLSARQYGFFLPSPNSASQYYLIHYNPQIRVQDLMFSSINMIGGNQQPEVLQKNISIVHDTIAIGGIGAIKHANGRDWWIVCTVNQSNEYYILLLNPNGISLKQHLNIGIPTNWRVFAEMNFSPDGTKLAYANSLDDLRLFDFDRCTGLLTNPQHYPVQDTSDILGVNISGMAFSADSRYLYRTTPYQIYQYDMLAPDIGASRQIVAEFDGFIDSHGFAQTTFGFMELAPDGRIFCKPISGGAYHLHVIWHPERAGVACDVRQHVLEPPYPVANMPMMPIYKQGAVDGSDCDTLGFDNHPLAGYRYDKIGGLAVNFTSVSWYLPDTWAWDFGDPNAGVDNSSTERNPVHLFSSPGTYQVCMRVGNQYGQDTMCKMITVGLTGVAVVKDEEGVVMFPNPTSDWAYLSGFTNDNAVVLIYDSFGKEIKSFPLIDNMVYVGDLPEGMYRINVLSAGSLIFSKNLLHINN